MSVDFLLELLLVVTELWNTWISFFVSVGFVSLSHHVIYSRTAISEEFLPFLCYKKIHTHLPISFFLSLVLHFSPICVITSSPFKMTSSIRQTGLKCAISLFLLGPQLWPHFDRPTQCKPFLPRPGAEWSQFHWALTLGPHANHTLCNCWGWTQIHLGALGPKAHAKKLERLMCDWNIWLEWWKGWRVVRTQSEGFSL